MAKEKEVYEYDKYYGKILGMSNSGYTTKQIASALHISDLHVLDAIQRSHARRMMYRYGEN